MFTELTINNFKNFKHLEVKDIKLVNTISGFNQSGKTTFLEAISFLTHLYTTNAVIVATYVHRLRDKVEAQDLLSLFYNLDFSSSPLELSAIYGQTIRKLKISLELEESIKELKCEHIINNRKIESIIKLVDEDKLVRESNATPQDYAQQIPASFLSSNTRQYLNKIIDSINKYGKQQELVNFLNVLFAEKITSIFRYQDGVSITKENIQERIPINLLGDGFRKALEIFGSWFSDSKVILIDEIENGLHHSLHKKVIASIFKYAHKTHIQVFIATHNQEILTTINEVLTENQEYQQDYSHYMLANTPKGNKAYRLNNEELDSTLASTFDVRGK